MSTNRTESAVQCPACGASGAKSLWRADSSEAAQHFVLREADPERHTALRLHIEARWQGPVCGIMECGSCGFGFAWPYIDGGATFYDLAYTRPGYPSHRWEFDRTLAALRHLPIAGKALEIGAGFGMFLDMIAPALLPREAVVAVEYNREARQMLTAKGYHTIDLDVRDAAFPADIGPFDLVFLFQVLEHMDRLDAVFSRLGELTAAQGHIFIAVPNPRRIAFNEHHGGLLDMPPNHIGKWTMTAFDSIASRHGFSIVEAERESCNLMSLATQDTVARYLRRSQEPKSLANRVRRRQRSRARRIAEFAVIASMGLSRLPAWASARRHLHELGESLWLHLQKA